MNSDPNLREYFLDLAQRWYLIVGVFLIGALLGWGGSQLWPPTYRASVDAYVGLNAYRGPRDRYIVAVAQDDFDNLDDYKNWQMEQLNTLARNADMLQEALDQLREQDPYWRELTLDDLYAMLGGAWRNAGRWHLTAEASQPEYARQAVQTWGSIIHQRFNQAISHARTLVVVDSLLVSTANQISDLKLRQQKLEEVDENLEEIFTQMTLQPLDEPLPTLDRWNLLGQVSGVAGRGLGWEAVLEAYPAPEASRADYIAWLDRVKMIIESELENLPEELRSLQVEHDVLADRYAREAEQSHALSPNMSLDINAEVSPRLEVVRPSGILMFVGGILAVLTLLGWELLHLTKGRDQ